MLVLRSYIDSRKLTKISIFFDNGEFVFTKKHAKGSNSLKPDGGIKELLAPDKNTIEFHKQLNNNAIMMASREWIYF